MTSPHIRELERAEIEPHIPLLLSNGFTPEIDQGVWIGAFEGDELAGWVRVFNDGGAWMLEDVFVLEPFRRRGYARTLIEWARKDLDHLWLICDDEMTGYYEGLGFAVSPKADFPDQFATMYAAKQEWPEAPDHNHNAMRWPATP